jgi:hypothetical protein
VPHATEKVDGAIEEIPMKRFFCLTFALVLLCVPAFAGKKSQTVYMPEAVQLGSTKLPAGEYKMIWTGSGSNVQVTLLQKEKAVATFPATAVEGKNQPGVTTSGLGGTVVLESIQLDHVSLVLQGATHSGQ